MTGHTVRAGAAAAAPQPLANKLAIVGLGLLGGSIALAARARGVARELAGAGRSPESVAAARGSGAFDAVCDLEAAVRGADLVVLATPVSAMASVLRRAAPKLSQGCVVTDVGSVKSPLTEILPGLLSPGAHFVGSHPMAGSHERGLEHARADLFEAAVCVVTPTAGSDDGAVTQVEAFWRALGARVERRSPDAHDAAVGWVSHVPHALAFAFAAALGDAPAGATSLAGPGFATSRAVARSDAELWSEILTPQSQGAHGPFADLLRVSRRARAGTRCRRSRRHGAVPGCGPREAPAAANESKARSGGEKPEIRD